MLTGQLTAGGLRDRCGNVAEGRRLGVRSGSDGKECDHKPGANSGRHITMIRRSADFLSDRRWIARTGLQKGAWHGPIEGPLLVGPRLYQRVISWPCSF